MAKTVLDFGEKIGGARKDFYAVALNTNDMDGMNEAEKKKYVKRDSIWKKEDAAALIAAGMPREVAYWRNEMRISFPPRPYAFTDEYLMRYIQTAETIRDLVMHVQTVAAVEAFYKDVFFPRFLETNGYSLRAKEHVKEFITRKLVNAALVHSETLKRLSITYGMTKEEELQTRTQRAIIIGEIGKEITTITERELIQVSYRIPGGHAFFYGDDKIPKAKDWVNGKYAVLDNMSHRILAVNCTRQEATQIKETLVENLVSMAMEEKQSEKKQRKKKFPIPEISNVIRKGPEYRTEQITGEELIREFGIRGGEFGHWMSDADSMESLNRCYESFRDLARILDVSPKSLSFHGKLAIGFGSRGHSAAAAHYETARQVINLTKYRGQGALCHEWAHALDHTIGQHYGCREFASEDRGNKRFPGILTELLDAFIYKEVAVSKEDEFAQLESRITKHFQTYLKMLDVWKPKDISETESNEWDDMVHQLWVNPDESILDAISRMRKRIKRRVIPKQERKLIFLYAKQAYLDKQRQEKLEEEPLKTKRAYTDFYAGSKKFDGLFTRMGHQYWSSKCEMFARAFDCYVSDKLKERGEENSYLTYGADAFHVTLEGKHYAAIPEGEERERINGLFDELLDSIKEEHIL